MSQSDAVARARALVADAAAVTVLTGAGISTDSGIQDFRGPDGLWTKNPEAEKMATLQVYVSEPEVRVKAWQNRIKTVERQAQPNAGHLALVGLERQHKLVALITQNIDGLHLAAGTDAEKLIEIHGTMREVECLSCGERAPMERALDRVRAGEADPPCRSCGGILKSATISFGQSLVARDLMRAEIAAQSCDLLLAVGSTLAVFPAAEVVPIAHQSGARIVIVNNQPTTFDDLADVVVRESISDVLPTIVGPA
jgi:NAD-dependent deacetylase